MDSPDVYVTAMYVKLLCPRKVMVTVGKRNVIIIIIAALYCKQVIKCDGGNRILIQQDSLYSQPKYLTNVSCNKLDTVHSDT
jgi:hypothetical protein